MEKSSTSSTRYSQQQANNAAGATNLANIILGRPGANANLRGYLPTLTARLAGIRANTNLDPALRAELEEDRAQIGTITWGEDVQEYTDLHDVLTAIIDSLPE